MVNSITQRYKLNNVLKIALTLYFDDLSDALKKYTMESWIHFGDPFLSNHSFAQIKVKGLSHE